MIRIMKLMWANFRQRSLDLHEYEGFNWAAGELLRGVSFEELEAKSLGMFNHTASEYAFNNGVCKALGAAESKGWRK